MIRFYFDLTTPGCNSLKCLVHYSSFNLRKYHCARYVYSLDICCRLIIYCVFFARISVEHIAKKLTKIMMLLTSHFQNLNFLNTNGL